MADNEWVDVNSSDGWSDVSAQPEQSSQEAFKQYLGSVAPLAVGGGAYLGTKAVFERPMRQVKSIDINLKSIREQYGLGKVRLQDIPKQLNTHLSNFDKDTLSPHVDSLAMEIKKNTEPFFSKVYENYGKQLDSFDALLDKETGGFVKQWFNNNVLGKTIQEAIDSGVPEADIKSLRTHKVTF